MLPGEEGLQQGLHQQVIPAHYESSLASKGSGVLEVEPGQARLGRVVVDGSGEEDEGRQQDADARLETEVED